MYFRANPGKALAALGEKNTATEASAKNERNINNVFLMIECPFIKSKCSQFFGNTLFRPLGSYQTAEDAPQFQEGFNIAVLLNRLSDVSPFYS